MARVFSVHHGRIGRSPGTVEYLGQKKVEQVTVRACLYDGQNLQTLELAEVLAGRGPGPGQTLWVDVLGLHDADLALRLGERFGVDTLVLEDVLSTTQRAKVEDRDDFLYLVCRSSIFTIDDGRAMTEQVSIILGRDFVLSFQEREPDVFAPVRDRLERGRGRLRVSGAPYLAYALLDAVVDGHLLALSQFGERVEVLEEKMLAVTDPEHFTAIHRLKRELVMLRKVIRPMREMTMGLARLDNDHFGEGNRLFLNDLHDHTIQAGEAIDSYNELLDGMHDFHQSTVGQRLNEVMKVLTVISTLFVPLTFVAGIYGMNFAHMPELGWRWSYPLFWLVIASVSVGMLSFFRRRKWL